MTFNAKPHLFIILAATMTLVGCNKDDVIESGGQGGTTNHFRSADQSSSATVTKVFEYLPAPGQFINDPASMGEITSQADACLWAEKRLDDKLYVSLGSFGGYIVVGFDHSVASSQGGYDFGVAGNAFFNAGTGEGGSNEPGIVWVMQDTNGNGLPDDTWYELAGSDYDSPDTRRNFAITYRCPSAPQEDVTWTDSDGNSGTVPYLAMFHKQDYYYPTWVDKDEYTLTGTKLEDRMYKQGNIWNLGNFDWGYVDNMGTDNAALSGYAQCNRFRISDARQADGSPANLQYIDFVKVQSATCAANTLLGEVSTEVFGVIDLSLYT